MQERIAENVLKTDPSMTLTLSEKAKELTEKGEAVISFGTGEPDFPTPEYICEGAVEAIGAGYTKYDAVAGVKALREAIGKKLREENGLNYDTGQIVVTSGAKSALSLTLEAIVNPGDEVIIPVPYWVSYTEMVKLAGGVPVLVPTTAANLFKLTPEILEKAITPKTKAVMLNTPNNPTGVFYRKEELEALAKVIVDADIYVLSDEIYESFVYTDESPISIAAFGDGIKERTIVINGFSKTYAMTGWRLGYLAAPPDVAAAIIRIQGHTLSHPSTIAQYAGLRALSGQKELVRRIIPLFAERRQEMMTRLDRIPEFTYTLPESTFYIFANISALIGSETGIKSSMDFCMKLLEDQKVVTIPGEAFGMPEYLRFSFATSLEKIDAGFDRMETFVNHLKRR